MTFSCGIPLCALLSLALVTTFQAQVASTAPMEKSSSATSVVDNDFIQKRFGETCKLMPGPPPIVADLDGDGIEDVVIPARCTNPMIDQAEYSYKVIDPYDAFFGYGDPKITTKFASEDPDTRGVCLLVIHGLGADAWRAETPKAKFMMINLPFKSLAVKKMDLHKKKVMAIYAEEAHEGDGSVSVIFWDGKKYRYQPMGSTME